MEDYLSKPFRKEQLDRIIKQWVRQAPRMQPLDTAAA
jgi:response regulator of citrate/malate metabolism